MDEPPHKIGASARLKLQRAEHHILDLNRVAHTYYAQKPIRLMVLGEPKADRVTHFVKENVPLPAEVPLIIGDAVHNLRSALDMLMFELVGHLARRPENVQFPFARRAESLESTITNREANLAGEKVVREIKRSEPYKGGNRILYAIHELDVLDKHKLITPVNRGVSFDMSKFKRMAPTLRLPVGNSNAIFEVGVRFVMNYSGTRAERIAHRRHIRPGEYESDIQPTFHIG